MMQEQTTGAHMHNIQLLGTQDGKVPVTAVFTVIAAGAAAVAVMATPVGLIELVTSSVGLSEILPMAAPPLGMTARLLLAAVAAALAAALVWVLRRGPSTIVAKAHAPDQVIAGPEHEDNQGAEKMGFALPKFMSSLKRGLAVPVDGSIEADGALARRRADAHPDAPPRRPIFASSDLANASLLRGKPEQRSFESEAEPRIITSAAGLRMPQAPEPMAIESEDIPIAQRASSFSPKLEPEATDLPEAEPVAGSEQVMPSPPAPEYVPMGRAVVEEPAVTIRPLSRPSLEELDVTALADRFETGLARRAALAGAAQASQRAEAAIAMMDTVPGPVPSPANPSHPVFTPAPSSLAAMPVAASVPVKPSVDAEIDEALRAALGTLQRMTARAG